MPIRVLIIDDSKLAREALRAIFETDPDITVIGEAKDGLEGFNKAMALKPDVITMDLKMPIMNGMEAIEQIMQKHPIPIIVVSTIDEKVIVKALTVGAMDFVAVGQTIDKIAHDLIEKIKIASRIKPIHRINISSPKRVRQVQSNQKSDFKIVAIGVSTGGPHALETLFAKLPDDLNAGILIVQHISPGFISGMVQWLRGLCSWDVKVAKAQDTLEKGQIIFASDDFNMKLDKSAKIILEEDITKKMINVPNIDVMMQSAAESFGDDVIGVIMTGMGHDGVQGIQAIKQSGGFTIAQDDKSSAIYGMNKVAIEKGYVDKVASLDELAQEIVNAINQEG